MKETIHLVRIGTKPTDYSQLDEIEENSNSLDGSTPSHHTNHMRNGTIFSSSINLANTNIGIGTVGLAYGISQSGWLLGIILFIFCHCLNHLTMYYMMKIASKLNVATYATVCIKCKVSILQIIEDWVMMTEKIIAMASYLIIIGDFMSLSMKGIISDYSNDYILYDRRLWISIWLILFITPTSCLKKIDALKYSSVFALLCFAYLIIIIFYYKFDKLSDKNPNISAWPTAESPLIFARTIALIILAYGGQSIAFGVTTELINPTMKRLNQIIFDFNAISTFVFSIVAFGGYLTFGDETDGNLLTNYPDKHVEIIIVRICLAFAIGFTYPLQANICKNCLASIIYGVGVENDKYSFYVLCFGKNKNDEQLLKDKDATMISNKMYYPLVVIVILVPYITAMSTDRLSALFQFSGATVGTFNKILFPAIIYCFANKNGVISDNDNKITVKLICAVLIIIGGSLLIPLMTYFAFVELLDN